ncbi:unnamed protein product, partial [Prorocentrum cordatum]
LRSAGGCPSRGCVQRCPSKLRVCGCGRPAAPRSAAVALRAAPGDGHGGDYGEDRGRCLGAARGGQVESGGCRDTVGVGRRLTRHRGDGDGPGGELRHRAPGRGDDSAEESAGRGRPHPEQAL